MKKLTLTIESGFPLPGPDGRRFGTGNNAVLRATLAAMKRGDSFKYEGHVSHLYPAAKQIGATITIRKIDGCHRVWRTNNPPQTTEKEQ